MIWKNYVGWENVYNNKFREIAEDEGFSDFYHDRWGAQCVRNVPTDELFCGDDTGMFPWFTKEKDLRKRLRGKF